MLKAQLSHAQNKPVNGGIRPLSPPPGDIFSAGTTFFRAPAKALFKERLFSLYTGLRGMSPGAGITHGGLRQRPRHRMPLC